MLRPTGCRKSEEGWGRIAGLMGRDIVAELQDELRNRLTEVHEMTEGFFAPDACAPEGAAEAYVLIEDVLDRWESYPAMRSARAVEIWKRVRPEILRRLAQTAQNRMRRLLALDGFLRGLPAGVQLFCAV